MYIVGYNIFEGKYCSIYSEGTDKNIEIHQIKTRTGYGCQEGIAAWANRPTDRLFTDYIRNENDCCYENQLRSDFQGNILIFKMQIFYET